MAVAVSAHGASVYAVADRKRSWCSIVRRTARSRRRPEAQSAFADFPEYGRGLRGPSGLAVSADGRSVYVCFDLQQRSRGVRPLA
jgi:hypothetical protein